MLPQQAPATDPSTALTLSYFVPTKSGQDDKLGARMTVWGGKDDKEGRMTAGVASTGE